MSFVLVSPDVVAATASELAGIGSSLSTAHALAATPTTGIVVAAGDEVSAAIAALFSGHGQAYQSLAAQAGFVPRAVGAGVERGRQVVCGYGVG